MSIRLTLQSCLWSCLLLLCKCSLNPLGWICSLILWLIEIKMLLWWVSRTHRHIWVYLLEELLLRRVLLVSVIGTFGRHTYLIQGLIESWLPCTLEHWAWSCIVEVHWFLPRYLLFLKWLGSLHKGLFRDRTWNRWGFWSQEYLTNEKSSTVSFIIVSVTELNRLLFSLLTSCAHFSLISCRELAPLTCS